MDITTLGIDVTMLAAIIAGTKLLTVMIDPAKKLERFYPLVPIILAIPVSMLRYWAEGPIKIALMVIVFGFIAGHAYKTGKTTVLGQ